ncbi:MAG: sigma-70 family RNA polymerase sigma factor [Chloroflexi bacterium]|nr:sigma-70 family RNA polymerase sigma factor [Chloroflexota bacterium]MBV9892733.1 sigma-70 family RNA polymerase sigma factor [Chloroflexota bacterium]
MIDHSVTACAPLASGAVTAEATPLDADAFALLYERHLPGVYRFISSRVGSPEEAEDLTAEAFRAAWTSRRAYRGRGTFRAWLFCIVRRTVADHYRRHRPATVSRTDVLGSISDLGPSPEEEALRQEQQRHARTMLAGLSQLQQEVLSLRFAAELSYPEIAVVTGKREEAVKKIAQRALEAIRGRQLHAQPN